MEFAVPRVTQAKIHAMRNIRTDRKSSVLVFRGIILRNGTPQRLGPVTSSYTNNFRRKSVMYSTNKISWPFLVPDNSLQAVMCGFYWAHVTFSCHPGWHMRVYEVLLWFNLHWRYSFVFVNCLGCAKGLNVLSEDACKFYTKAVCIHWRF